MIFSDSISNFLLDKGNTQKRHQTNGMFIVETFSVTLFIIYNTCLFGIFVCFVFHILIVYFIYSLYY